MSFNNFARKVRRRDLPLSHRRSALASSILRLCWLTGQPFGETKQRYNQGFHVNLGLGPLKIPTEEALLKAIAAVEVERNQFLEQLRAFERRRIRDKMRGKRQPSKSDRLSFPGHPSSALHWWNPINGRKED